MNISNSAAVTLAQRGPTTNLSQKPSNLVTLELKATGPTTNPSQKLSNLVTLEPKATGPTTNPSHSHPRATRGVPYTPVLQSCRKVISCYKKLYGFPRHSVPRE